MQKVRKGYNRIMDVINPFIQAVVVLSLLLAGAILLDWISVSDSTGLGYFLLVQGFTVMVWGFINNKKEN